MCRVLERESCGDIRAIGVVWISCRPSKPVTRVRILYRPPSLASPRVLSKDEAPFLRHLGKHLSLEWLPADESRLGMTRFEYDHHELFRRRRLRVAPGSVTIGLNRILAEDEVLFRHTLVHELLHAAGLIAHGGNHAELVKQIAPAPSLARSPVLRRMRREVLDSLPERQWICGNCGHTWQRVRVSAPTRCPKCARPFSPQ